MSVKVSSQLCSCRAFSAPVWVIGSLPEKLQTVAHLAGSSLRYKCTIGRAFSVIHVPQLHPNTITLLDPCCPPLHKYTCIQVEQQRGHAASLSETICDIDFKRAPLTHSLACVPWRNDLISSMLKTGTPTYVHFQVLATLLPMGQNRRPS